MNRIEVSLFVEMIFDRVFLENLIGKFLKGFILLVLIVGWKKFGIN